MQKLKKMFQQIKRFPERLLQKILDIQLITLMLKFLIALLISSCFLAIVLVYYFESEYDMSWWVATPAMIVIALILLRIFAISYARKKQFRTIQDIYKAGNNQKMKNNYQKETIYRRKTGEFEQKYAQQHCDLNDNERKQYDQNLQKNKELTTFAGKQYQSPFSRSFFADKKNSKDDYKNYSIRRQNAQSSFNWGQRMRKSLQNTNKQNSLIRNFIDYTLNKDESHSVNRSLRMKEQGKSISKIFDYFKEDENIPSGHSRVHSSTKISEEKVIRFIPREYLQSQRNSVLQRIIDQYYATLQRYGFQNKNMDDRYDFVKKSIHKLLKKHNQQQAISLLMFAQAIQAFFQVKIYYKNPYFSDQQFSQSTGMLIQYSFPSTTGSAQKKNTQKGYLDFESGKYRIMQIGTDYAPIRNKMNQIVKDCVKNSRKEYISNVKQCYQQIQLYEAIQKVLTYVTKKGVQCAPFRYRYPELKEEIFIVMSNLVITRKQLDVYLIDIHEKNIKGIERIEALQKSVAIQKNLGYLFQTPKFYQERRQAYENNVDKNSERAFLFNFFCSIIKRNLENSQWLSPSMKSPSFFSFGSAYYAFYRQTGYQTGQPHYNLRYKDKEKQEIIHCCPGKYNFYCAVFFYLLTIQEKQQKLVKQKPQLRNMIGQMLPLQGI